MKKAGVFLIFLGLLLSSVQGWSQDYTYRLLGFIGVKGGESFTYELHLTDSTDKILTGYAYSYVQPNKDIKANVLVYINRTEKTLQIREVDIIYNHGFKIKAVLCLLNSSLSYDEKAESLSGRITSKTAGDNGLACADGSLSFVNKSEINALFEGVKEVAEAPVQQPPQAILDAEKKRTAKYVYIDQDSINRAKKEAYLKTLAKRPDEITEGKDKTYVWNDTKVIMEIWDGNNEDNDRVTVECNGQVILENYTLRNRKHKVAIDIGNNELNIITVRALSEGGDPPNTANITIYDGDKSYDIVAHNKTGKSASFKIKRNIGN